MSARGLGLAGDCEHADIRMAIAATAASARATRVAFIASPLVEQIVRNAPLITLRLAKEFGHSHVEHAPALEPESRVIRAVCQDQFWHHALACLVEIRKPLLRRACVVSAADPPLPVDPEILLKV